MTHSFTHPFTPTAAALAHTSGPTPLPDFVADLRRHVRGDVRDDAINRLLYSTDASLYQVMPHAVFLPRDGDDMQAAIETAIHYQIPLLARGGGSSLGGQAVNAALIMDTSRHLDGILEINPEEQWVRVQPGVVLDTLNDALRPHRLQFGPDPASSNRATMAGIISNNASGSHSILYGMSADHVLEMTTILDDGSMAHLRPLDATQLAWERGQTGRLGAITADVAALISDEANLATVRAGTPRHWRRSGGYNLARFVHDGTIDHFIPQDGRFNLCNLVTGAEGTLAAITELKLKLVPRPARTALCIVEFPTLQSSLEATPAILETAPSAVELVDDLSLRMAAAVPEYARLVRTFLRGDAFCFLGVEYYGESEAELRAKCDALISHLRSQGVPCGEITALLDPKQQAAVWNVRKVGLGLLMSVRSDFKPIPFIEDTAVPPQHLAEYIPRIEAFCRARDVQMTYYAHASAGCLHIRPLINIKEAEQRMKMEAIAEFVADLQSDYGGSISSEHGDGRVRSWLAERVYGPALYALLKDVKGIFDPHNRFNPGNIVDAPSMLAHLRYGDGYQPAPIRTQLHFAESYTMAVEMCNGAAVCRKLTTGAMCPSFIATREEEHSTRGRANLLRSALSGRLPLAEMQGERLYQAMELCVGCKACKAECPSSVDMAKLKTEFLAGYYEKHSHRMRDYLFAHIDPLAAISSGWLAPVVNWTLRLKPVKSGFERWLGISSARTLPVFSPKPLRNSLATRNQKNYTQNPPVVTLVADTLNAYSTPHVTVAAAEVLEAAGYRVQLAPVTDAGRPALSKGMVTLARRKARNLLHKLAPAIAAGTPIIFLEPSDWSAVVDDYQALLPDDERLAPLAARCVTFEQFIAAHSSDFPTPLRFRPEAAPQAILLHGHCHQKALTGTAAAKMMLGMAPGVAVSEIDSSCCGMAGSFGYEAEHYVISKKMAEHRLADAVRNAPADTWIVAAGVSCRQQIAHVTGRTALHPAEALHRLIQA